MRLIDADALELRYEFGCDNYGILCVPLRDVNESIKKAKTIDAVPIVRCKDCKHHYDCGIHFCDRLGMDCPDDSDFFCSYGERKDGDSNG